MAAFDDLIAQVEDTALRIRLKAELDRLAKRKKFGLVFEEHLPELTPVYGAKIDKGCLVALREQALTNTWKVLSINRGKAQCTNTSNGKRQDFAVADLVVVRQFGEPIFPSLVPIDRCLPISVTMGGSAPIDDTHHGPRQRDLRLSHRRYGP